MWCGQGSPFSCLAFPVIAPGLICAHPTGSQEVLGERLAHSRPIVGPQGKLGSIIGSSQSIHQPCRGGGLGAGEQCQDWRLQWGRAGEPHTPTPELTGHSVGKCSWPWAWGWPTRSLDPGCNPRAGTRGRGVVVHLLALSVAVPCVDHAARGRPSHVVRGLLLGDPGSSDLGCFFFFLFFLMFKTPLFIIAEHLETTQKSTGKWRRTSWCTQTAQNDSATLGPAVGAMDAMEM